MKDYTEPTFKIECEEECADKLPSYYDDVTISVAEVVELLRKQTVCPDVEALKLMSELTDLSIDLLMDYCGEESEEVEKARIDVENKIFLRAEERFRDEDIAGRANVMQKMGCAIDMDKLPSADFLDRFIDKSDRYWDAYWDCVDAALRASGAIITECDVGAEEEDE